MSIDTLRDWTAEHKEEYAAWKSQYKKDHADANRKSTREYARRLRTAVLAILGGKCVKCGFSDTRALQADHKSGDGNKERKAIGPHGIYRRILSMEHPEDEYQLLCANCNWIKRFENGEHS